MHHLSLSASSWVSLRHPADVSRIKVCRLPYMYTLDDGISVGKIEAVTQSLNLRFIELQMNANKNISMNLNLDIYVSCDHSSPWKNKFRDNTSCVCIHPSDWLPENDPSTWTWLPDRFDMESNAAWPILQPKKDQSFDCSSEGSGSGWRTLRVSSAFYDAFSGLCRGPFLIRCITLLAQYPRPRSNGPMESNVHKQPIYVQKLFRVQAMHM